MNTEKPQDSFAFEEAFTRLEEILEQMNEGKLPLEEALKKYEEADRLVIYCHQKLTSAEQKIEMLMKNREGALALDEQSRPLTQPLPQSGTPEDAS